MAASPELQFGLTRSFRKDVGCSSEAYPTITHTLTDCTAGYSIREIVVAAAAVDQEVVVDSDVSSMTVSVLDEASEAILLRLESAGVQLRTRFLSYSGSASDEVAYAAGSIFFSNDSGSEIRVRVETTNTVA